MKNHLKKIRTRKQKKISKNVFSFYLNLLIYLKIFLHIFLILSNDYCKINCCKKKLSKKIFIFIYIIANFNEKLLHRLKEERGEKDDGSWLDDELFVVGFQVTSTKNCRILDELYDSRIFDVVVFKIIRKGRHINLPMPDYDLAEGDIPMP